MLADSVSTATETIAQQGSVGAFAVLLIGAVVYLWRRDVRRSDEALTFERARAERAETRATVAESAKSEVEREVRTETTRIMQTTADRLEDTALVLRDVRRRP